MQRIAVGAQGDAAAGGHLCRLDSLVQVDNVLALWMHLNNSRLIVGVFSSRKQGKEKKDLD